MRKNEKIRESLVISLDLSKVRGCCPMLGENEKKKEKTRKKKVRAAQ
jgi:hypothetical protein